MRGRLTRLAVTTAAVLQLTACYGDAAATVPTDPCDVVTETDIGQVLGDPVEERAVGGWDSVMCSYQTAGFTNGAEVAVMIDRDLPFDEWIDRNTRLYFQGNATNQPVEGLGERAVGVTGERLQVTFLFVRVAGANLTFRVIDDRVTAAEQLEIATQVARAAVERLS